MLPSSMPLTWSIIASWRSRSFIPTSAPVEGFERAFRLAAEEGASIKHPNIAEIYDWGADSWNQRKAMYVIVEHLGGGSLREYLDRGRTLSPSQALMVGLEACKALDVIHRHGLVHGDIRPSTLVFGDDERLRVTDVGLANVVGDALWADRAHVSNALAMYASPEFAEFGVHGPKGDVYSLCLTMFESMYGSVPFAGDSTVATLSNRVGRLMPVSADLGPLAAVLERAGRPLPEIVTLPLNSAVPWFRPQRNCHVLHRSTCRIWACSVIGQER